MPKSVGHGEGATGKRRCPCELCRARKAAYERERQTVAAPRDQLLDLDTILRMKRELYLGDKNQGQIAAEFKVTQSFVSQINRGKSWRGAKFHPTEADRRERDRLAKARETVRKERAAASKAAANARYAAKKKERRQEEQMAS